MEGQPYIPVPHVSPALRHIRLSVTVCAWVLGLALFLQVLTWALVNYTDIRTVRIEPVQKEYQPTVVRKAPPRQRPGVRSLTGVEPKMPEEHAPAPAQAAAETPAADVNRGASRFDIWLRAQHQLALAAGVAGCLALVAQLAVGTVVAAGASIYGLRRVVSAQAWSLVLLGLCLPWNHLAAEFPFGGVFTTYDAMTAASDAHAQGLPGAMPGMLFYGRFFLLPAAAGAATALIGLRFACGVETGIVASGPTPEELAIEAEASNRKAGSLLGAGRIGGALEATLKTASIKPDSFVAAAPRAMAGEDPHSRRPI